MPITLSASCLSAPGPDDRPIVGVRILPIAVAGASRRNFHLALLLDTSGSMEGGRIDAVKRTLHLLIDALVTGDVLTMIRYHTTADFVAEAVAVDDTTRPDLHTRVDGLRADGGTNLEAALMKLGSVSRGAVPVDAVFLMTDGQVNQGIAGSAGLLRIAGSVLAAGVPVNTLGYGAEHNARLLRDMAVRSRGSYTYADTDELLPAIIGDIMGGLEAEVSRNGMLVIPPGWRSIELGSTEGETAYAVGTLIADKEQWVVLEGPVGCTEFPTIEFQSGLAPHVASVYCCVDESIPRVEIAEQRERVRVATVFAAVTELLEQSQDVTEAVTMLEALGTALDGSVAKDRDFVIRLRAQVDEMLEALRRHATPSDGVVFPMHRPRLQGAGGWPGGGVAWPDAPPPNLAPVLSRMASNTTALGNQRGFFTMLSSAGSDPTTGGLAPTPSHAFASPSQRAVSERLASQF